MSISAAQEETIREVLWQILDDMQEGKCVCGATKDDLVLLYNELYGVKEPDGEPLPLKFQENLAAVASRTISLDSLGGFCPVQADGTYNGHSFYFRSRGSSWSIGFTKETTLIFLHEEYYGPWPSAGYISQEEARSFILRGVRLFDTFLVDSYSKVD